MILSINFHSVKSYEIGQTIKMIRCRNDKQSLKNKLNQNNN